MAEAQPPTQAENKPAATGKNPARFMVHVQQPWDTFLINKTDEGLPEDLLLTRDPVEVSFDQAAVIQETAAAAGAPVVIEEKKTEK